MTERTEGSALRGLLWDTLINAWPYDDVGACGMCFANVPPDDEHRRKHAEWHIGTMPEDQWETWAEATVQGVAAIITRDVHAPSPSEGEK